MRSGGTSWARQGADSFDVHRFYPKTQLSWLARLDHSHCNSADPLTDGLEVCCVFYRPGPGGCYVCCVVVEGFGERGVGGLNFHVEEPSVILGARQVGAPA